MSISKGSNEFANIRSQILTCKLMEDTNQESSFKQNLQSNMQESGNSHLRKQLTIWLKLPEESDEDEQINSGSGISKNFTSELE